MKRKQPEIIQFLKENILPDSRKVEEGPTLNPGSCNEEEEEIGTSGKTTMIMVGLRT